MLVVAGRRRRGGATGRAAVVAEAAQASLHGRDAMLASEGLPPALLEEALRLWGDAMNVNIGGRIEHWERHGLTTGQLRLMHALSDHGEPMPLGELAQFLGVSPATMTGITTRLVRRRLIERIPDAADRRVIKVALTAEGARALAAVTDPARAFYAELLSRLGRERTEQLVSLFGEWVALADRIKRERAAGLNGARPAGGRARARSERVHRRS